MGELGPNHQLSSEELDRALRLSLWEGRCWGLMVGLGETYFLANAVRHEATNSELALVVSLPLFAGALGPLLALRLLSRAASRRAAVVTAAAVQAAIFIALSVAELEGWMTPRLLIVTVCGYQIAGMAASTLWSSWYADLVPAKTRGRYFARRNRGSQFALFLGLAMAGLILHLVGGGTGVVGSERAQSVAFAVIFTAAGVLRTVSVVLLARSPERRFGGLASFPRGAQYLRSSRGRAGVRVLLIGGAVQLATYLASPFFVPFMLEGLRFSYLELMLASSVVVAAKVLLFPAFGRQIDSHGATPVFRAAVLLVALVPLPWVVARGLPVVLVAQALSGMAWACYEVSFFSVLVESSQPRVRPYLFAAQNLLNGSAQLLGALFGAALLAPPGLSLGGSFHWLFAISAGARLLVAVGLLPLLPKAPPGEHPGPHHVVLRAIGFRTNGGVVHRPVDLVPEPEEVERDDSLAVSAHDEAGPGL